MIEPIASSLQEIVDSIETVPPEQARYIEQEKKLAIEQNNVNRYNLMMANRFYYPLMFHNDYNVAAENLRAAKGASGKDVARYLVVVLARMGDLKVSMGEYIEFDLRRQKPILDKPTREKLWFVLPLAKGKVISLLQCVISQL